MSVFLTPASRLSPHNQRKVKASHPWKAPGAALQAASARRANPVHVAGCSGDEDVMLKEHDMAEGCYRSHPHKG